MLASHALQPRCEAVVDSLLRPVEFKYQFWSLLYLIWTYLSNLSPGSSPKPAWGHYGNQKSKIEKKLVSSMF